MRVTQDQIRVGLRIRGATPRHVRRQGRGGRTQRSPVCESFMIHPPEIESKKWRAYEYCHGFRKGVAGAYIPDQASEDMKRGYEDGRKALASHAQAFCDEIGHDPGLGVLR